RLYERSWRPAGAARGAVVIVHGLKDHGGRYAAAAEELARRGFAVYALDLRGHGRSDGPPVRVDSFDDYLDDLALFVGRVRERGRPLFRFGHSMGGAIAPLFVLERRADVQGLILSAPALRVAVSPVLAATTRALGTVAPGLPVLSLASEDFSRDPAVVRENEE